MAIELRCEKEIHASPERVYAVLTDLDAMAKWMPNFVGVERLTDGPFGPGTEFRETRKMFGKEATEHFEVKEVVPNERVRLFVDGTKGASKRGAYDFTYHLRGHGDHTHLVLEGRIDGGGWFMELIGKLFAGPMKKAFLNDMNALAAYIERG